MQSIAQWSTAALRSALATQPTTDGKVAFAWQIAAGPALARNGVPHWTADGILRIDARDAAWGREFRRARPVIIERLTLLLGPDIVRRLVIDEPPDPNKRERQRHA
jgi:hypothetical protein